MGWLKPPTRQNEENSQPTWAMVLHQKEMLPAVNEKIQTAEDEVEKAERNSKKGVVLLMLQKSQG